MQQVCAWATELVADGACTRFAFDTYEREVERYGGEDGVRMAEVFMADSPAAAGILRLTREGGLSYDMMTVAVLSIDDLLAGVGLDAEQRTDVHRDAAARSHHDGEEYRRRQRELRQFLGRPGARRRLRCSVRSNAKTASTVHAHNCAAATSTCTPTGCSDRTRRKSSSPCSCSGARVRD